MRYLSAAAVLSIGCFSKPTFDGRNDANPDSDASIVDGRPIAGCDWLGTPGLLVYLPFDEATGTTARDLSGMSNHGTLMGGSWTAGKVNGGLTLTGNQLVDLGSAASLDNIRRLTTCAWVRLDQSPTLAATIVDKSANGFVGGWNMYIQENPNSPLGFLNNDGNQVYSEQQIVAGRWTHVCASWNGTMETDAIALYVDGIPVATRAGDPTNPQDVSDASYNLVLGRGSGVDNYRLNGTLDEFVLFDHVLSATEIQIIHGCAN